MGAGYASGKYAIALCDQCGQRFKLNALIKDWKGFKVCQECYEPKHPQLEPKRTITEPQALFQPRTDTENRFTRWGFNTTAISAALLQAVNAQEPGYTLFVTRNIQGRPIGDITGTTGVTIADYNAYNAWLAGTLDNQAQQGYIANIMYPYMLAYETLYNAYLTGQP